VIDLIALEDQLVHHRFVKNGIHNQVKLLIFLEMFDVLQRAGGKVVDGIYLFALTVGPPDANQ